MEDGDAAGCTPPGDSSPPPPSTQLPPASSRGEQPRPAPPHPPRSPAPHSGRRQPSSPEPIPGLQLERGTSRDGCLPSGGGRVGGASGNAQHGLEGSPTPPPSLEAARPRWEREPEPGRAGAAARAPSSVRSPALGSRAPPPRDRDCQAKPRPPCARPVADPSPAVPIGCGSRWLRPLPADHTPLGAVRSAVGGWGPRWGEASCGVCEPAPSSRALQLLFERRPKREEKPSSLGL